MKKLLHTLTLMSAFFIIAMEIDSPRKEEFTILVTSDGQHMKVTRDIINMLPTIKDALEIGLNGQTIPVPQNSQTLSLIIKAMHSLSTLPVTNIDPGFFEKHTLSDVPAQVRESLTSVLQNEKTTNIALFINALNYFQVDEAILNAVGAIWVIKNTPWYNVLTKLITSQNHPAFEQAKKYGITDDVINIYIQKYIQTNAELEYSIADLVALKKLPKVSSDDYKDHNIKVLDLSDLNIVSLVGMYLIPFSTRRIIEDLDLYGNKLTTVSQDNFEGFINLHTLNLTENNISKLNKKTFEKLQNLKTLYISINNLTTLKKDRFGLLPKLTVLHLSSNNMQHISRDAFIGLTNLRKLYLLNNNLTNLRRQTFIPFNRLKHLEITHNPLTQATKDMLNNLQRQGRILNILF